VEGSPGEYCPKNLYNKITYTHEKARKKKPFSNRGIKNIGTSNQLEISINAAQLLNSKMTNGKVISKRTWSSSRTSRWKIPFLS